MAKKIYNNSINLQIPTRRLETQSCVEFIHLTKKFHLFMIIVNKFFSYSFSFELLVKNMTESLKVYISICLDTNNNKKSDIKTFTYLDLGIFTAWIKG